MQVVVSMMAKEDVFYHKQGCPCCKIKYQDCMIISEEEARKYHYKPCSYCEGILGEIRTNQLISEWERKYHMKFWYDEKWGAIMVKTEIGLWKIMEDKQNHCYILFHKNTKKIPKEKGQFHRQKDCLPSTSLSGIISYIAKHDKAKQIIKEDYRKLPKSTNRERKYYNHAKRKIQKMEGRNKMYRLDQIYKELEHA
nr:hypothetical protein [uncultured Blautia sp.]